MTTTPHEELTAAVVIGLIESGAYPRDIVVTIARGFLPLAQEDLVAVLAYLGTSGDPELAELARTSLNDVPSRAVIDFAANESAVPEHLERLMRISGDPYVLEALIRNRTVPDHAVAELARRAEARVQEVIVINHARILRAPEILDALLENPAATANIRRLVHEVREEFFVKKAARAAEEEPEIIDLPLEPIADLLERAEAAAAAEEPSGVQLTESEKKDEKASVIWTRLQFMSISEKVRLAYRGDRMIRMLLVRDRNKLICSAVMRNPRMNEQEAEAIAGMRNVDEEVLRILGMRRDWMGKYKIMYTLVRNPKAPLGVVLPFVNRLTLRDLKGLKDDKGVQQVVREMARKAYLNHAKKQSG
ncbi:MAG TPA: hypothetical protein VEO54_31560 [Thermoanaerobaculia bacterium]|nr:hypothetical protein [Thermoanaerobaculia bacterium]